MTTTQGTAADWRAAIDGLVPTPARYRQAVLDRRAVRGMLRCDERVLDALVTAGLSSTDSEGEPRFDYTDVMNLGLRSGTGLSLAEVSLRQCLRFTVGNPDDWQVSRQWRLRLEAACASRCPGPFELARPATTGSGTEPGWRVPTGSGGGIEALVHIAGVPGTVCTAAVRDIFADIVEGFSSLYRFGWLAPGLRSDLDAALRTGTLDCVATSLLVRQRCERAGVPVRTRKGFLLGMVGVEHAWAEVHEQGRWLAVDPLLAHLASQLPSSRPEFTGFCLGSLSNRLLVFDLPAWQDIATHTCPHGEAAGVTCRQLPTQPP